MLLLRKRQPRVRKIDANRGEVPRWQTRVDQRARAPPRHTQVADPVARSANRQHSRHRGREFDGEEVALGTIGGVFDNEVAASGAKLALQRGPPSEQMRGSVANK